MNFDDDAGGSPSNDDGQGQADLSPYVAESRDSGDGEEEGEGESEENEWRYGGEGEEETSSQNEDYDSDGACVAHNFIAGFGC